jgi:chaperonin GroEL
VTNRVCFDLEARAAIKRGFDRIADIAQVTLGPVGGVVAVERIASRNSAPELLTDTGTITRRIIEMPGHFENMGAMLARHMAWRIHEDVGDGSATALVIAQSIIADAVRYVAAGHNAMTLWQGIKHCQSSIEAHLRASAQPLEDPERIAALGTSLVEGDEQVGRFIEEIFDIVGPKGFVEVRSAYGMESDREYVEGVYWDSGWVSPYFADKDIGTQATVEKPYILVTDYVLESAPDLVPVLERVRRAGGKSLVVIAADVKSGALNLMVSNNAKGTMRLLALKAPRYGDMRLGVLEDIAISCGARFIRKDAGDLVSKMTLEDLGRAQNVVCNRATFTLVGTIGNPLAIRERIRVLQSAREHVEDKEQRDNLDERIGKLLGGTALLHVSGQSKQDRERRKDVAKAAVRVVRQGLQGGIVPGGGVAYVSAASTLDAVQLSDEEAPARDIVRRALLAPLTRLAANAGYDPGPVVAHVQAAPEGWGFDVVRGRLVDMMAENIVDPLPTVLSAFSHGLSAASMALTTDALIYRSYREKTPNLNP